MRGPSDYLGLRQHGPNRLETVAKLLSVDICDARCPAAAGAVVVLGTEGSKPLDERTLLLCTHHLNVHEPKLATVGATIYRKENR